MVDWEPGSESWWRAQEATGIPTVERQADGTCRVTFWWRDPQGNERHSPIRHVWIYITGVTDHHPRSQPQSLSRLPGTDAWCWQTVLPATWRGSYCLLPSCAPDDFPPAAFTSPPDKTALRTGWRHLLKQAIADPFNPTYWQGGRGHPTSGLHLPDAPLQPGWGCPDTPYRPPACLEWQSARLGNQRRVWIFTTGDQAPERRPLAILLDGQFWAQSMPLWPVLQTLTDAGKLPPAVYLLIDVINTQQRTQDLTCNPDFWLAVQQELLPLARQHVAWRDDAASTIVAGQSFGGLSALYAGLHWPEQFGCVLSQSGSYWWPNRDNRGAPGFIETELQAGNVTARPLRIFLEAGIREPLIHQAHQRLVPLLRQTQPQLVYREHEGGHDALCWRGGLSDGLSILWAPLLHPRS